LRRVIEVVAVVVKHTDSNSFDLVQFGSIWLVLKCVTFWVYATAIKSYWLFYIVKLWITERSTISIMYESGAASLVYMTEEEEEEFILQTFIQN